MAYREKIPFINQTHPAPSTVHSTTAGIIFCVVRYTQEPSQASFSQAFLFPGVPFSIRFPLRSRRGSIPAPPQKLLPAVLPKVHLPGCWCRHREVPQLPGDGELGISSYLLSNPHRNSVIRGQNWCLWLLLMEDLGEYDPDMEEVLALAASFRMSQSFRAP